MFAKYGAKVLACDKRERTALGENADKAEEYGAELHLGENYLKNLGADIIFRTPGMKYYMDELVEARTMVLLLQAKWKYSLIYALAK